MKGSHWVDIHSSSKLEYRSSHHYVGKIMEFQITVKHIFSLYRQGIQLLKAIL